MTKFYIFEIWYKVVLTIWLQPIKLIYSNQEKRENKQSLGTPSTLTVQDRIPVKLTIFPPGNCCFKYKRGQNRGRGWPILKENHSVKTNPLKLAKSEKTFYYKNNKKSPKPSFYDAASVRWKRRSQLWSLFIIAFCGQDYKRFTIVNYEAGIVAVGAIG